MKRTYPAIVAFLLGISLITLSAHAANDGLDIGETGPAFTLDDSDGKMVSLTDFKGKVTVLVFYRGNW